MILLKSIRRRLVTGFTVALALLLMMAAAAIWGLARHQNAISDLNDVVHRSPDKAKLLEAVTLIQLPLAARVDLSRPEAVVSVRNEFLQRVQIARTEAETFFRRCEEEERKSQRWVNGRHPVLQGCQRAVDRDLTHLQEKIAPRIRFDDDTNVYLRIHMLRDISLEANLRVIAVVNNLTGDRLPSYEKQKYVEASLDRENKLSRRLLGNVKILIAVALITYAITLLCGFRWISNPLRAIARGASRIANGDTRYRLGSVSPWDDEFADLTTNFNRMADRFQESEDHLSAKVEERSRQLVRSERLAGVGFLAAGLAHEVNNPLQAMAMAAESVQFRLYDQLDPDSEDTKEAMDRLDMIQRESKRCGQITRRLLDFSRNERMEKQTDDLARVVSEVLAMIRPMSKYRDRKVAFECSRPVMAEINASQMKQVVLNLVANGLQATDAGGKVEVRVQEQTDWIVLEICDDGQGMEAEHMEQLFEPFFSTKETGKGTGLGLSITHRIIEDHHGTIDPHSDGPGQGSRFVIRLPRRQPHAAAA